MLCSFYKRMVFLLCASAWLCVLVAGGCRSAADYKAQSDKEVYKLIDEKWEPEFGAKANYRISDVNREPNDIQVDKLIPESGVLALPEAVAIATVRNRDYQFQRELLYTTALDAILIKSEFQNQFFSGGRSGLGKEGDSEGVGAEADAGFQRMLASGGWVGARVGEAWFDVLRGDLTGGLTGILSTMVWQPLLRGSNRQVVMENLTQAERDTLYSVRAFNRFRETFVVQVIGGYYGALGLAEKARNAEANHTALEELYGRVQKLAAVGRVPKEEVDRVHQDMMQAEEVLIKARKEYKQALDEFKFWQLGIAADTEFELDSVEVEELKQLAAGPPPDFSEAEAIETAFEWRLDVANSGDAVDDAERKVVVAADALRGRLDLYAGVDATTLADASERPSLGALDDDLAADRFRLFPLRRPRDGEPLRSYRNEVQLGLDWELPLYKDMEQNVYRKALILVNQRQREYEELRDLVTLEVRQAYRDLTEAAASYRVQMENLELAGKRLEDTNLLIQYGRASSRRVLDAQRAFFDAQNDAIDALVLHATATLNFWTAAGVLQVRPDGMWQNAMLADKGKSPAEPPVERASMLESQEEASFSGTREAPGEESEIMATLRNINAALELEDAAVKGE